MTRRHWVAEANRTGGRSRGSCVFPRSIYEYKALLRMRHAGHSRVTPPVPPAPSPTADLISPEQVAAVPVVATIILQQDLDCRVMLLSISSARDAVGAKDFCRIKDRQALDWGCPRLLVDRWDNIRSFAGRRHCIFPQLFSSAVERKTTDCRGYHTFAETTGNYWTVPLSPARHLPYTPEYIAARHVTHRRRYHPRSRWRSWHNRLQHTTGRGIRWDCLVVRRGMLTRRKDPLVQQELRWQQEWYVHCRHGCSSNSVQTVVEQEERELGTSQCVGDASVLPHFA